MVRVIGRVEKKNLVPWLTLVASLFYAFSLINPRSSFQSLLSRSSIPVPLRYFFLTIPLLFICQKIQQEVNSYDFKAQYHTLLYFHVLFIFFGIAPLYFQVSLKVNTNPFLSFQKQAIQLML